MGYAVAVQVVVLVGVAVVNVLARLFHAQQKAVDASDGSLSKSERAYWAELKKEEAELRKQYLEMVKNGSASEAEVNNISNYVDSLNNKLDLYEMKRQGLNVPPGYTPFSYTLPSSKPIDSSPIVSKNELDLFEMKQYGLNVPQGYTPTPTLTPTLTPIPIKTSPVEPRNDVFNHGRPRVNYRSCICTTVAGKEVISC